MKKNILGYTIVLFTILSSGSIIFSFKYRNIFMVLYLIISMVYFIFYRSKMNIKNILILLLIYIAVIGNSFINYSNGIYWGEAVVLLLYLFLSLLNAESMTFSEYKIKYINIIEVLSIVSLVVFWGTNFNLLPIKNEVIFGKQYKICLCNVVGWDELFRRNAGVFWEPGLYQIFLNIGLVFLVDSIIEHKQINIKQIIKFFIAIVTVVTTKSTAGYIILTVILVYSLLKIDVLKINKYKACIYKIFAIIIAAGVTYVALNSSVVVNKLTASNYSYKSRNNHMEVSIDMIKKEPIIGYGIRSYTFLKEYNYKNNGSSVNSNGLLVIMLYYGVVNFLLYFLLIFFNLKNKKIKFNKAILFIIIIMFYSTEVFYVYPIANIFIMNFLQDERFMKDDFVYEESNNRRYNNINI